VTKELLAFVHGIGLAVGLGEGLGETVAVGDGDAKAEGDGEVFEDGGAGFAPGPFGREAFARLSLAPADTGVEITADGGALGEGAAVSDPRLAGSNKVAK
jgi:hypothetical protein